MRFLITSIIITLLLSPLYAATWVGDQTIAGSQTYSGETITCSGDITINSSGKLHLTNGSILEMDCATDGEHTITVQNNGELKVLSGSKITAKDPAKRYKLVFRPGSKGSVESATVEDTYDGFVIETSNLTITDSTIQRSKSHGVICGNNNPSQRANNLRIRNSKIRNNAGDGIRINHGSNNFLIDSSTIESNANGIVIMGGSTGEVSNNIIISNEVTGIIVSEESFAYIHDNSLTNNTTGITCDDSDPIISDNTFTGGEVGVKVENDANPILGDLSNSDTRDDGGNTFTDQISNAVENTTSNIIKMDNNDLGTEDPDIILDLVEGPTTVSLPTQITTSESGVIVQIPTGATDQIVSITVEVESVSPGALPSGKRLASNIYDIQSNVTTFSSAISVTIPTENGFFGSHPYYWNGTSWTSDGLTVTSRGTDSMTFTTTHLSVYAVLANTLSVTSPVAAPNPFNPQTQTTNLIYWLDTAATTTVYIFDLSGNLIWRNQYEPTDPEGGHANYNQVEWNGSNMFGGIVANGVYIFKVISGGSRIGSGKIMVIR